MPYYLKCTYAPWNDPDEYLISFNTARASARNWCFVLKKDVTPINGIEGLARVLLYSENPDNSIVGILEAHSPNTLEFEVPSKEIVKK
ncbi:MAG: hypothetical protein QME12_03370 [Nanoarchaeota archaeon]|nr:hypothetical protein [Nanoarchaeota archaeon]